jgi:hypothetical protein
VYVDLSVFPSYAVCLTTVFPPRWRRDADFYADHALAALPSVASTATCPTSAPFDLIRHHILSTPPSECHPAILAFWEDINRLPPTPVGSSLEAERELVTHGQFVYTTYMAPINTGLLVRPSASSLLIMRLSMLRSTIRSQADSPSLRSRAYSSSHHTWSTLAKQLRTMDSMEPGAARLLLRRRLLQADGASNDLSRPLSGSLRRAWATGTRLHLRSRIPTRSRPPTQVTRRRIFRDLARRGWILSKCVFCTRRFGLASWVAWPPARTTWRRMV